MNETVPRVGLPSAEMVRMAISAWWRGGGTANLIVNVLRRGEADLDEAQAVAQRLAESAERLNFISDRNIEEALEAVRAVGHAKRIRRQSRGKDPDDFDSAKCVFNDVFPCPQCTRLNGEETKHGHLLSPEEWAERFAEIRVHLAGLREEHLAP